MSLNIIDTLSDLMNIFVKLIELCKSQLILNPLTQIHFEYLPALTSIFSITVKLILASWIHGCSLDLWIGSIKKSDCILVCIEIKN